MKRMMIAMMSLCACAGIARASATDELSGTWRGVVRKGMLETVVWFDFSPTDHGYRGNYWATAPAGLQVPLTGIELGHSVRFEVPGLGVFHGEIAREAMEGTFEDTQGGGSFLLEKQLGYNPLPDGA